MSIYANKAQTASIVGKGNGSSKKGSIDETIRKGDVYFPSCDQYPKTFNIIQSVIIESYLGVTRTDIDLTNIAEIQYARYDEGCFFKRHRDVVKQEIPRLLTLSVNISNETDYTGGELVVFDDEENQIAQLSKEPGSFIIFPAMLLHEAKIVTSGTREAIVTWIHSDVPTYKQLMKEIYDE